MQDKTIKKLIPLLTRRVHKPVSGLGGKKIPVAVCKGGYLYSTDNRVVMRVRLGFDSHYERHDGQAVAGRSVWRNLDEIQFITGWFDKVQKHFSAQTEACASAPELQHTLSVLSKRGLSWPCTEGVYLQLDGCTVTAGTVRLIADFMRYAKPSSIRVLTPKKYDTPGATIRYLDSDGGDTVFAFLLYTGDAPSVPEPLPFGLVKESEFDLEKAKQAQALLG